VNEIIPFVFENKPVRVVTIDDDSCLAWSALRDAAGRTAA
jgi:hypothetical protein